MLLGGHLFLSAFPLILVCACVSCLLLLILGIVAGQSPCHAQSMDIWSEAGPVTVSPCPHASSHGGRFRDGVPSPSLTLWATKNHLEMCFLEPSTFSSLPTCRGGRS